MKTWTRGLSAPSINYGERMSESSTPQSRHSEAPPFNNPINLDGYNIGRRGQPREGYVSFLREPKPRKHSMKICASYTWSVACRNAWWVRD